MTTRFDPPRARAESVALHAEGAQLEGDLVVPAGAQGVVVFAHGSGSSRHSVRNRAVARVLSEAGLATLLMDLLSQQEEVEEAAGSMRRFDVELLAARLEVAHDWLERSAELGRLRVGYFGSSTGAAAALIAAAMHPERVAAVVSRGGRPDLARVEHLSRVRAPTRLIIGGRDVRVLELNREAYANLRCERDLIVVPGATHLFEEPGALDQVAEHARDWFVRHLSTPRATPERRPPHERA